MVQHFRCSSSGSIVIRDGPSIMRSFLTCARCMAFTSQQLHAIQSLWQCYLQTVQSNLVWPDEDFNGRAEAKLANLCAFFGVCLQFHSSCIDGFQPYELMFGRKAPTPCDDWLGLAQYKSNCFKSMTVWLNQSLVL